MSEIEELLQNDDFVRWVLGPDEASQRYWEGWLRQHPDKAGIFQKAQELVRYLHGSEQRDADLLKQKNIAPWLWDRINEEIKAGAPAGRVVSLHPSRTHRPKTLLFFRWLGAASLAGLLGAGGYWFYHRDRHLLPAVSPPLAGLTVKASGRSALECINRGNTPQRVHLVDGSLIILGGNSSLHYEKFLQKDKREVYLDGEAFFDIATDAARPFYVHARGVLTQVLGTSFRIIARKEDKKIIVAVSTGKVAVGAEHPGTTNKVPEYILQANQEVVFDASLRATGRMPVTDTGLVAKPDLPEESFSFSDVPVSTVFRKLSDVYSVKIVYDEQQLSKCLITVSLDALSFEEKLALVCKVLGVQYREEDYQIVIEGKGCQ